MKVKKRKILLHRFMTVEKLIGLIENRCLVFIKPEKWLDPFENVISKVKFKKDGEISYIDYLKNVYGICFTKANESNLMWDSYTPNGNGVRVTFNKQPLLDEILTSSYKRKNFAFKYVKYVRYDEIMAQLLDRKVLKKFYVKPSRNLLEYLFVKRNAFRYEEEFRIIYNANEDDEEYNEVIMIDINPELLIEQIRFNPKMADSDCSAITEYLIRQEIPRDRIKRSLLYKRKITTTVKL